MPLNTHFFRTSAAKFSCIHYSKNNQNVLFFEKSNFFQKKCLPNIVFALIIEEDNKEGGSK